MTTKELVLLQDIMNKSENYLEFGSGNSTFMAVNTYSLKKITVVESDANFWREKVYADSSIKNALHSKRLKLFLINIGNTGEWGYPSDYSHYSQWPLYHSEVFKSNSSYDLLLIDGRFRVACILHACLSCPDYTKIVIHDFFNRPYYFVVLPFLNIENKIDTMGIFTINRKKVNRMIDLLKEYIAIYEYLPGY